MSKTTEQDEAAGRAVEEAPKGPFAREAELRDAALDCALGGADLEHCGRMRD